jgi:hypothetical protein
MRRIKLKRRNRTVNIPTGIVTVPSNKIRGYYSQFVAAEKFLARRRKSSGKKDSQEEG